MHLHRFKYYNTLALNPRAVFFAASSILVLINWLLTKKESIVPSTVSTTLKYFSTQWKQAGTSPGRLGDRYTGLGTQTQAPKNHFSSFVFSVVFQQKICWSSVQWFQNASNYFEMAQKTKMQKEAYLLKRGTTSNQLKPPKTTWNYPETTWNNLKPACYSIFLLNISYFRLGLSYCVHLNVFFGQIWSQKLKFS